jgi:hypothetical protein
MAQPRVSAQAVPRSGGSGVRVNRVCPPGRTGATRATTAVSWPGRSSGAGRGRERGARTAMLDAAPAERAGLAAGLLNAARQVAGGLGIAVFGELLGHGFEAGMRLSLTVSAVLLTVTFALSFRLSGRSARRS